MTGRRVDSLTAAAEADVLHAQGAQRHYHSRRQRHLSMG